MANKGKADSKPETGANLGFEAKLWQMADGLRNNMDAAEYKHGNHFPSIGRNKIALESFLVGATTALLSSPLRAG
jgi:hypothetical protein